MDISGTWYNELNSAMNIDSIQPDGSFTGTYQTQGIPPVPLIGKTDINSAGLVVGFVVVWPSDFASVTTWSGLLIPGQDPQITADWLLTAPPPQEEQWKTTNIGQDIFKRQPFSDEVVAAKLKTSGRSHPRPVQ